MELKEGPCLKAAVNEAIIRCGDRPNGTRIAAWPVLSTSSVVNPTPWISRHRIPVV